MKAVVFTRYGSPDVLELRDVAKPVPGDDEVLIKVRYDLILDVKTNRSILDCARALSPGGRYVTVGGSMARLLQAVLWMPWFALTSSKKIRLVVLKPNKDLAYMRELFEAGKVLPVIDGRYGLGDVPQAFRHFGEGLHKGKIVITV